MRIPALLLLALLATTLCACQGAGRGPGASAGAASTPTPMRFRGFTGLLARHRAAAQRGDVASVRAGSAAVSQQGLALIQATLPHDVARTDVPRYLEGRARFGEALKAWVEANEAGADAEVVTALRRLDDATRGWIDAYLGREPETSI